MELEGTVDKIIVRELNEFWYCLVLKEHPNLFWATKASLPLQKGDYVKIKTQHISNKPLYKMTSLEVPGDYIKKLIAFREKELFLEFYKR